ncbi:MAG: Zn-ribbon domain-containing OB-fold protein [Candidatus Methanomethylicia archaeon]
MEFSIKLSETTIENFYRKLEEGKLVAAKCSKCGVIVFPPRPICPSCYSESLVWIELEKEGEIITYTIIHVAPPSLKPPYVVAVVKLKNNIKIIGMLKEDIDKVKVGLKVKIEVESGEVMEGWPIRPKIVFTAVK